MNKKQKKRLKINKMGKNAGLYQTIPHKPYKKGVKVWRQKSDDGGDR